MNFVFVCWKCDEDCEVWGQRFGVWGDKYRLPEDWECWRCGAVNTTPDGPWTPAD